MIPTVLQGMTWVESAPRWRCNRWWWVFLRACPASTWSWSNPVALFSPIAEYWFCTFLYQTLPILQRQISSSELIVDIHMDYRTFDDGVVVVAEGGQRSVEILDVLPFLQDGSHRVRLFDKQAIPVAAGWNGLEYNSASSNKIEMKKL